MTTGITEQKIRRKSMMYVFAKKNRHRIVDVDEEQHLFRVKYEEPLEAGLYYQKIFEKEDYLEDEIRDAMHQLTWIASGNEFPEDKKVVLTEKPITMPS